MPYWLTHNNLSLLLLTTDVKLFDRLSHLTFLNTALILTLSSHQELRVFLCLRVTEPKGEKLLVHLLSSIECRVLTEKLCKALSSYWWHGRYAISTVRCEKMLSSWSFWMQNGSSCTIHLPISELFDNYFSGSYWSHCMAFTYSCSI